MYGRSKIIHRDHNNKVIAIRLEDSEGEDIYCINAAHDMNPDDDSGEWLVTGCDVDGEWYDTQAEAKRIASEMARQYYKNYGL